MRKTVAKDGEDDETRAVVPIQMPSNCKQRIKGENVARLVTALVANVCAYAPANVCPCSSSVGSADPACPFISPLSSLLLACVAHRSPRCPSNFSATGLALHSCRNHRLSRIHRSILFLCSPPPIPRHIHMSSHLQLTQY